MAGERMWVCASREKGKERAGEGDRRGGMVRVMGGGRTVESNFSTNTSLESDAARRSHGCLFSALL
jgi:hypothetical protein